MAAETSVGVCLKLAHHQRKCVRARPRRRSGVPARCGCDRPSLQREREPSRSIARREARRTRSVARVSDPSNIPNIRPRVTCVRWRRLITCVIARSSARRGGRRAAIKYRLRRKSRQRPANHPHRKSVHRKSSPARANPSRSYSLRRSNLWPRVTSTVQKSWQNKRRREIARSRRPLPSCTVRFVCNWMTPPPPFPACSAPARTRFLGSGVRLPTLRSPSSSSSGGRRRSMRRSAPQSCSRLMSSPTSPLRSRFKARSGCARRSPPPARPRGYTTRA